MYVVAAILPPPGSYRARLFDQSPSHYFVIVVTIGVVLLSLQIIGPLDSKRERLSRDQRQGWGGCGWAGKPQAT